MIRSESAVKQRPRSGRRMCGRGSFSTAGVAHGAIGDVDGVGKGLPRQCVVLPPHLEGFNKWPIARARGSLQSHTLRDAATVREATDWDGGYNLCTEE